MNGRRIRRAGNQAVEGIYLSDEMAFTQTTNGRVAAHRSNRMRIKGDQSYVCTHARCYGCSLAPSVAAAYDYDVEFRHERPLLPARLTVEVARSRTHPACST